MPTDLSTLHAQQLANLTELIHLLNSTRALDAMLALIMERTLALLDAEAGSLILVEHAPDAADAATDARTLVFHVTRGMHAEQVSGLRLPWGTGLIGEVAAAGVPLIVNDVHHDPRWEGRLDHDDFVRAMLVLPLVHQEQVRGVLTVLNKRGADAFTANDIALISAFAEHAALAIENARLHQAELEQQRIQHELQLAYQVQASLIPRALPRVAGWECAAWWHPARTVGGDYYDFITLPGALGLVIGDVSDKGMPAALFMALARSTVRASVTSRATPADALAHANRLLCEDSNDGMFITLFYGTLDWANGTFTYVNAGHNPPLLWSAATQTLTKLTLTGPLMGFLPDAPYTQGVVTIAPGDRLVLYTDGITEARNAAGNFFTDEAFYALIAAEAARGLSAADLCAALHTTLDTFTADAPQFDDITLVVLARTP